MDIPSHWQDPERPSLVVEHKWLYPAKRNDASSDYRYTYNVPGVVKRGRFVPFSQSDADAARAVFNSQWLLNN